MRQAESSVPPVAPTWFVYIVRCVDRTLYTGVAIDVRARVQAHNAGKGARYTRARLPVKLVYCEPVESRSAALKREYAIKQLRTQDKRKLFRRRAKAAPSRGAELE